MIDIPLAEKTHLHLIPFAAVVRRAYPKRTSAMQSEISPIGDESRKQQNGGHRGVTNSLMSIVGPQERCGTRPRIIFDLCLPGTHGVGLHIQVPRYPYPVTLL